MKNNIVNLIRFVSDENIKDFHEQTKSILNKIKEHKLERFGSRVKREILNIYDIKEDVVDILRNIVNTKSAKIVKFKDGSTTRVDLFRASALVKVYDALKSQNQKKMREHLIKNKAEFKNMLDFALANTR